MPLGIVSLFPEIADHAFPFVGKDLMTGIGWMNIIPKPVDRSRPFGRTVERGLEMHNCRTMFLRKAGNDRLSLGDVRIRRSVLRRGRTVVHDERLRLGVIS